MKYYIFSLIYFLSSSLAVYSQKYNAEDIFTVKSDVMELTVPRQIKNSSPYADLKVSFETSDSDVATVNANGLITAHKTGMVSITAHCDDYYEGSEHAVASSNKTFNLKVRDSSTDPELELQYLWPLNLESDYELILKNRILPRNPQQWGGKGKDFEYTIGYYQNNKLVRLANRWTSQGFYENIQCQYNNTDYINLSYDEKTLLADGEYELRLFYRSEEMDDGVMFPIGYHREGEAVVYLTVQGEHLKFRAINRQPCDVEVEAVLPSSEPEVGLDTSFEVKLNRTSEPRYYDDSFMFCYVNGVYVGGNRIDMLDKESASYVISDFDAYRYYLNAESPGIYQIQIFDGRWNLLYDDKVAVGEKKDYELSVVGEEYRNTILPGVTFNANTKILLKVKNIGENTFHNDILCQAVTGSMEWYPERLSINIAPNEITEISLPIEEYLSSGVSRIRFRCQYAGKFLWESPELVSSITGIIDIPQQKNNDGSIYNLQGQKLRNASQSMDGLAPGLYIVNGRKIKK